MRFWFSIRPLGTHGAVIGVNYPVDILLAHKNEYVRKLV